MDSGSDLSTPASPWNTSNINQNTSANATADYVPYEERPETYIVPTLFAIIFIVGVLGNGALILIFARHRRMRNVPNTYIFSLALGDLLVIVTCVPFVSTVYTFPSWPYGEPICKLAEFVKDLSVGVSVFTLTALSADRFFAIVDPMRKHAGRRATRLTVATAASIWILAVGCGIPALIGSYLRKFEYTPTVSFVVCYPYPSEWGEDFPRAAVMAKFLVYYMIPLTIIAFFYALMARHLIISARRGLPGEAHQQTRQAQARRKVAKTVLAFVVVFAACFLPQHIFMLWFYYNPTALQDFNGFWLAFRTVGFCLGFLNSCVNPIALYCISGTFRKHFNRHLFCCCVSNEENGVGTGPGGRVTRGASARSSRLQVTRDRTTKTTWESSHSLVHFNSTLRRPPDNNTAMLAGCCSNPSTVNVLNNTPSLYNNTQQQQQQQMFQQQQQQQCIATTTLNNGVSAQTVEKT
jgi:bombesin-like receptor 3